MEKLKLVLLLTVIFLLSACQSTAVKQDAVLLAPTHGMAIVHFPQGGYYGLEVEAVETGQIYKFESIAGYHGAKLWLPPGEYRLFKLNRKSQLSGYPKFTVKQGKVISMGSLVDFYVGKQHYIMISRVTDQTVKFNDAAIGDVRQLLADSTIEY